jgi:hypothetical protein
MYEYWDIVVQGQVCYCSMLLCSFLGFLSSCQLMGDVEILKDCHGGWHQHRYVQ